MGSHSWAWQGRNAYGKGNSYKFSTNAIRVDIVNETNQPQKEKETPQMIMIEMQTGARISNIKPRVEWREIERERDEKIEQQ